MTRSLTAAALGLGLLACAPQQYRLDMDGAGAIYTDLLPDHVDVPGPSADPIALPIEVVIDESVQHARWEAVIDADRIRLPVGEELATHLDDVVLAVFPQAKISSRRAMLDRSLLRARVVAVERTLPHLGNGVAMPFHRTTIVVEWRFEDPSGRLIWLDTVTASAEQDPAEKPNPRRAMLARLFSELYAESLRRLDQSVEVRAFAARYTPPSS